VIVTDHHQVPAVLPDALAILNPKRADCPSKFENLAGVGVAFCLVMALRKALRDRGYWKGGREPNLKSVCDLVALGTVADMVPLLEENRIYVKAGLDILASHPRPGLKALLRVAGTAERPIDTWDLAFRLAPRINAAGRLGNNTTACDLLTTRDRHTAVLLSDALDEQNNTRKAIEKEILIDVDQQLKTNPQFLQRSLVLESQTWHEGVIGIVASRLVAQFARPVVLIAVHNGMGKGSARAPEGFHLFRALEACATHLEKFGGHEAAAGLSVRAGNIPHFRRAFDAFVSDNSEAADFLQGLHVDSHLAHHDISPALADDLERLAPFGPGNPEPLFMISDLDVVSAQPVGDNHIKMRLAPVNKKGSKPWDAVFFYADLGSVVPGHLRKIACHVRWNRWQHSKRLQLVIKDLVPG
jgi:single-stranded-DNA-specific exonuclease